MSNISDIMKMLNDLTVKVNYLTQREQLVEECEKAKLEFDKKSLQRINEYYKSNSNYKVCESLSDFCECSK